MLLYLLSVSDEIMLIMYLLRYHPDKNANDPKASDMFNEITFSYSILSDPDKRHQYDTAGFEVKLSKILHTSYNTSYFSFVIIHFFNWLF